METFVKTLGDSASALDPCYTGFFTCFNRREYYEAHDVLEHLWLQTADPRENAYYKGLIQMAGAFVHLKKQRERPGHPKDGRRMRPAVRLFRLALKNLEGFGEHRHALDLRRVRAICEQHIHAIEESGYAVNPWSPENAPELLLLENFNEKCSHFKNDGEDILSTFDIPSSRT